MKSIETSTEGQILRTSLRFTCTLALVMLFAGLFAGSASAQWTETTISNVNGAGDKASKLVFDAAGNLYGLAGATDPEGPAGEAVYEWTPTAGGAWTQTMLYLFPGGNQANGYAPNGQLVLDREGNLYGTTQSGGNGSVACVTNSNPGSGCGVVFKLTPTASGPWTETVLYTFNSGNTDGGWPTSGVIFDTAGNLYGTASVGGPYGAGVAYKLTPTATGPWTETVLYFFCSTGGACTDGADPAAGLTFDNLGNLYGAVVQSACTAANGAIYKLTPTANGPWTETGIYCPNSAAAADWDAQPLSNLVFRPRNDRCVRDRDRDRERARHREAARENDRICGDLYGTDRNGGEYGLGNVFRLTPAADGTWNGTDLYDFQGSDGRLAISSPVFDAAGDIYGTTNYGGLIDGVSCDGVLGCGVAYELTPTVTGFWTETQIYTFPNSPGLARPGGVIMDAAGNLYGPASDTSGIFELSPPAEAAALKK
jgi:hypothetical protein